MTETPQDITAREIKDELLENEKRMQLMKSRGSTLIYALTFCFYQDYRVRAISTLFNLYGVKGISFIRIGDEIPPLDLLMIVLSIFTSMRYLKSRDSSTISHSGLLVNTTALTIQAVITLGTLFNYRD
jgi:hypothetical protein